MKYIKTFENSILYNSIKVGDYVMIYLDISKHHNVPYITKRAIDYMNSHFCVVTEIYNNHDDMIKVEFENVPTDIQSYFGKTDNENIFYRTCLIYNVVEVGKTPEELEINMASNKYNL